MKEEGRRGLVVFRVSACVVSFLRCRSSAATTRSDCSKLLPAACACFFLRTRARARGTELMSSWAPSLGGAVLGARRVRKNFCLLVLSFCPCPSVTVT